MKKLNLNRNTFAGGETLTREQLKKIMGGDGPETTGPGGGETTGDDFTTTGDMPCKNVVCQADSWCCDTSGVCISRNGGICN